MTDKATKEIAFETDPIDITTEQLVGYIKEMCGQDKFFYISDEDFAPEPFRLDKWLEPLTIANFMASLEIKAKIRHQERDFHHFFEVSGNRDPRWFALERILHSHLTEKHHFVIGDRQVDHYLIGVFRGSLVGIKNHAVET